MADIFLSYQKSDRNRVLALLELLEHRGWTVWWDQRIDVGTAWDETIEREIAAARCVVVVWTASSVKSRWVRREARHGLDREILVPILLDGVEIPLEFSDVQAADLSAGQHPQHAAAAAAAFLEAVERTLAGQRPKSTSQPGARRKRPWRESSPVAKLLGLNAGGRLHWLKPRHALWGSLGASLAAALALGALAFSVSRDLPDYEGLANYQPPITQRYYAANGLLLSEQGDEKRVFVPINAIPRSVVQAFLSAEDETFYEHGGIHIGGLSGDLMTRALGLGHLETESPTITQKVARLFFVLGGKHDLSSLIKEIIMAVRIERAYTKDKILELYLNQVYFGADTYGVAAASLYFFGKPLDQLAPEEAALLAAVSGAPERYDPVKHPNDVLRRRDEIIRAMLPETEAGAAVARPLRINPRPYKTLLTGAQQFDQEIRQSIISQWGDQSRISTVQTTLDPAIQRTASTRLLEGLIDIDLQGPWRGAIATIDVIADWGVGLDAIEDAYELPGWRMAVVLELTGRSAILGLRPARNYLGALSGERERIEIGESGLSWERSGNAASGRPAKLNVGDVAHVVRLPDERGQLAWRLVQMPRVNGAVVVLQPHTGRIHALAKGGQDQRTIESQKKLESRPAGSIVDPFVYLTALENGYSPVTLLTVHGSADRRTLRSTLLRRDTADTELLIDELGVPQVAEMMKRLGLIAGDDRNTHILERETSVFALASAFGSLVAGGFIARPTLVERVQDVYGKTIWRFDNRECTACNAESWTGGDEPDVADDRPQIMDPHSSYQLLQMIEATTTERADLQGQERPYPMAVARGASKGNHDSWAVGILPDHLIAVWIGYDPPNVVDPDQSAAASIAMKIADFIQEGRTVQPFRITPGAKLIRVSSSTGERAEQSDTSSILQVFKPMQEPNERGALASGEKLYRTMCVRLCDGAYFPISARVPKSRFERDQESCQSGCAAPAKLHFYEAHTGTEDTMSSQDGQSYGALPNAFRFRKEYVPGCSCKAAEYVPDVAER